MTPDIPPREAIHELARLGGLSGELALEPLAGGGNNRVYRLRAGERQAIVKWYFWSPADRRDRLAAETGFLRFAERCGLSQTPRLFAALPDARLALLESIPGRKLNAGDVREQHVAEAAAFFQSLNEHRATPEAAALPLASEACFGVFEHLACVRDRVDALRGLAKVEGEFADLIQIELPAAWRDVKSRTLSDSLVPATTLAASDRRLSPSDFGFHNAIVENVAGEGERLRFIDFEYAGWDDPAKTACDFACQVQVPVPRELAARFAKSIGGGDEALRERIDTLLPVYQIKWCCIVLSRLAGAGDERRRFSSATDSRDQKAILQKARQFLDQATTT